MTHNELQNYRSHISDHLRHHRIRRALEELDALASAASASWPIKEKIASLVENYDLMSKYALDGVVDSTRTQLRDDIVSGINDSADLILRESVLDSSSKLYFSAIRYERMQGCNSISSLGQLYKSKANRIAMAMMAGNTDVKEGDGRLLSEVMDEIGTRLFNYIWTKHPFSSSDSRELLELILDPTLSLMFKQQMIGALMLGAMEYYSEQRLLLLGEIYSRQLKDLDTYALCGLLLGIWIQRSHTRSTKLRNMFATLAELPQWKEDVKMTFLQFIRTRDTERINQTMRNDVIPSMMRMRPEINKIIKDDPDMIDPSAMEDNPEWEEIFEKSGLSDKLRELSEMQAEGADVMMSTFSGLKSFSFFTNVAHWFLPFFPEQHHVALALKGDSFELAELLDSTPMLCSSDKYSMVFSLEKVAGSARKVMLEQIKMQNINLAEIKNSSLLPESKSRENSVNKYVQDLYRFFTLYRRKNEFVNPFASPVNLVEIPEIAEFFDADSTLEIVAQFYFKRGYYNEAYSIYQMLLQRTEPDAQLFQKAGYCMQQLNDIAKATEYYECSELLNPDNKWTMRKLAACYRMQGLYAKAVTKYESLVKLHPDDLGLCLNLGHCYLGLQRYEDALKQYFKVEFLDEKSTKALRPIAWCLLVTKQFDRSRTYYQKIMANSPSVSDMLNFGHLEMVSGNFRKAIEMYKASISNDGSNIDGWQRKFDADRGDLMALGVDEFMIDLVSDSL